MLPLVSPSNQQSPPRSAGWNVQKLQISEDEETKDSRGEERPDDDGQGSEGDGEDEGPGGEVAMLLSEQRSERYSGPGQVSWG